MSAEHPLCPARSYVTETKRELFLAALKERRLNVSAACRAAGLASTGGVYEQRKADPEFAEKWAEIEAEILDGLEEKQITDAEKRPEDRRWVLSRRRPERWSEKSAIAVKGQIEHKHSIHQYSDEELLQIIEREGMKLGEKGELVRGERKVVEGE